MASVLSDLALRISAKDDASATINSMGAKIKKELGDITKLAAGLALGNLGANIGMDIAQRLKNAAEQIDTFGTAVRGVQVVTGASAESASALVAIFEHFGLSGEDAASKMSRFERALSGTETALDLSVSGGKRGQQILKDIGVAYQDASGKILPMDQVLLNLAARWQELDAASKNAAARGLFGGLGGQGAESLNLVLDQGRSGLEGLIAIFQKEGLILSQQQVDDVTKFTYAHKALDDAFKGLAISLGAAFMPAITATAAVVAFLTQKVIQDLVPAIKGWPEWIGPATLAVVGLGIGLQILAFVVGPILAPFKLLIGLITAHGAASSVAAVQGATLAATEAAAAATAAIAAVPTAALAVAEGTVGASALVATGLVDQYGNAIMREGALAAVAAPENATLAASEVAAGAAGTTAAGGISAMGAAAAASVRVVLALGGAVALLAAALALPALGINAEQSAADVNKKILGALPEDARKQAEDYINANMQTVADAGGGNVTQTGKRLVLEQWLKDHGYDEGALIGPDTGSIIDKIAKATGDAGGGGSGPLSTFISDIDAAIAKARAEVDASIKANTPTIPTEVEGAGAPPEAAAVTKAKADKKAADEALKIIQDQAAQRKDAFEIDNRSLELSALRTKLAADESDHNATLLGYKRAIEDLNNSSAQFALKQLQLDQQDRQVRFELSQVGAETQAMQLKLASDETDHNATLLDLKRQLEDVDRNSIDFALKRQQLNEQDAVTVARMGEDKLRAQADDLSFQEKLLIAQARATKMAGGNVDTGALRDQIMAIRTAQIANQPALLTAEHDTALANRAKQGTDATASLGQTQLEHQKLALQEAMRPYDDAALAAKRASEDAQTLLGFAKQRFDIDQQGYKDAMLRAQAQAGEIEQLKLKFQEALKPWEDAATQAKRAAEDAQIAYDLEKQKFAIQEAENADALVRAQAEAKKADEAYQAAVVAAQAATAAATAATQVAQNGINTAGGVGTAPYGPLPTGVAGGGGANTVNITNNNSVRSDADIQAIADQTTDQVVSVFLSATKQTTNKPAYHGLPGAYATSTP